MRKMLALLIIVLLIVGVVFVGVQVVMPSMQALARVEGALLQRAAQDLGAPASLPVATALKTSAALSVPAQAPTAVPQSNPKTVTVPPADNAENLALEAIYEKVNPSVVQITNLARSSRRATQATPQGEGSGFVWDQQGNIVTNDHVVSGADQLQVTFADGTAIDATLVATDPDSDLAVVKVDPTQVTLTPIEQGDINQVKVGQLAVAIGNPFGFQGTMTRGIVSAIGRSIPSQTTFSIPEAIQTDAAINPGNSGGPLLNIAGQVIGVNDQIQSSSGSNSGIGFAIPINIVQRVVPALIKNGSYQHAYLGISGGTYSKAWAQALGFPADAKGAYVHSVITGSPAQRAGIQPGSQDTNILLGLDNSGAPTYLQRGGDLITAIDGHPITKMDDLLIYLESFTSPGQTVQLSVLRDGGQKLTIPVRLGQRPSQSQG